MEKERLNKLKIFLDYDNRVKELMLRTIPKREELTNDRAIIEYEDELDKSLEEIEYYLYYMTNSFYQAYLSVLERFLKKVRHNFQMASMKTEETRKSYLEDVIQMRPEFLESLGKGFKGYSVLYGEGVLEPVSINEYLHLLHCYVLNNSDLYRSMPELDFASNRDTHLLGENDKLARSIAENLEKASIISGRIDIIGLNDRILIMARNFGHALTLNITYENGYAFADYFIPKVCNLDMVNALPGIHTVKDGEVFARGSFRTLKEEMPKALKEFIEKVPTDMDIVQSSSIKM